MTRHQHHKYILFDYSLHSQTLENIQSAKYLGITISDNTDWSQHISEISFKATKTLGFLRGNLAFAPKSRDSVWRRPSDIVQKQFQMSESLLFSLDNLSETIFRNASCTVMHSDAKVFLFSKTIADWPNLSKLQTGSPYFTP